MATPEQQLLSMMNPQQARLLDERQRQKDIIGQSRGAGMLSGLVQAGLQGADTIRGAFGQTPMGANEAKAIEQKSLLENQVKTKQAINQATKASVGETDLEKLGKLRDSLLAMNKVEATSQAQAIQKRIDAIEKQNKDAGKTAATVTAGNKLIDESGLTDEQKEKTKTLFTNNLLSAKELNDHINSLVTKNVEQGQKTTVIEQIKTLGLEPQTVALLESSLNNGGSPSSVINKAISLAASKNKPNPINTSDMAFYGKFTTESVDDYIKWKTDGGNGVPPKLVDLPDKPKAAKAPVTASSVTADHLKSVITLIAEEEPVVSKFFVDEGGWFSSDSVNKDKLKAYASDILTLRRDKNLSMAEAVKQFVSSQATEAPLPSELEDVEAELADIEAQIKAAEEEEK
jgi:hypothetical protein